jgi:hypothetical protein
MFFVLVWLHCGICAVEFRKTMTRNPVLVASESGFCGLPVIHLSLNQAPLFQIFLFVVISQKNEKVLQMGEVLCSK